MLRRAFGCLVIGLCGVLPSCQHSAKSSTSPSVATARYLPEPVTEEISSSTTVGGDLQLTQHVTSEITPSTRFTDAAELSLDALLQAVQERNPTLAQMEAAWQAAQARNPQVTALEDPTFNQSIGPGTFGSTNVAFAFDILLAQKIPFPGKRRLRGVAAQAEARAAGHEVEDSRQQLIESTRAAFYDYYLAERALAVNARALQLLQEFRDNASARAKTTVGYEQDVLQARVEIERQKEQELTLVRMKQVAIARINTLLHQLPDEPLPPSPKDLRVGNGLPDVQSLRAAAAAQRPDLQALAERVAAEEARVALTRKDYYPDFTPFAEYNKFMGNRPPELPLAYFLGMNMNLPVYRRRLDAAVVEACARLAQRRAELARQTDQVNYEVQEAYFRVQESEQTVRLYEEEILRLAEQNIEAAKAGYTATTPRIPFVALLQAERDLVNLQNRYYQAIAEFFTRRAALERAVGGSLP